MNEDRNGLQALADSMATKRQIVAFLNRGISPFIEMGLLSLRAKHEMRADLGRVIDKLLDQRYFSGFGRKKTIDKVIANAIRRYEQRLAQAQRLQDRLEKVHEQCKYPCRCGYLYTRHEEYRYLDMLREFLNS